MIERKVATAGGVAVILTTNILISIAYGKRFTDVGYISVNPAYTRIAPAGIVTGIGIISVVAILTVVTLVICIAIIVMSAISIIESVHNLPGYEPGGMAAVDIIGGSGRISRRYVVCNGRGQAPMVIFFIIIG